MEDFEANESEMRTFDTNNFLENIKDNGFRDGVLNNQEYIEEYFIKGAINGFDKGYQTGIIEAKIDGYQVILQDINSERSTQLSEKISKYRNNPDRYTLEDLNKKINEIEQEILELILQNQISIN